MPDTVTQEATNWTPVEAEGATEQEAPEAKTTEPVGQPKEKTYTEADVAEIRKQAEKQVELRLRHEITANTKRVKELEGKVRLSDRQVAELSSLNTRLDDQELMLAQTLDALKGQGAEIQDSAPSTYAARVLAKRKERVVPANEPPAETEVSVMATEALDEIKAMATKAGVDMNDEILEHAALLYRTGSYLKAVRVAEKVLGKKEAPKDDDAKKAEAKAKANSVSTGASGGAGASVSQLRQDYIAGRIDSNVYSTKMKALGVQP